jgi:hypothetical protein
MRIVTIVVAAFAIVAAFVVGRVTATPMQPVSAQGDATPRFSHFECYQSQFSPSTAPFSVQLTDQFQSYKTAAANPDMFCTPVKKKLLSGQPLKPPQPINHLTCYHIQGPSPQQTRPIANQLENAQVTVLNPIYLCVPTNKTG